MFSKLLVPLDGSTLAESALPVAERIAVACGASVVLLHILERAAPSRIHGERHLVDAEGASAYLQHLSQQLQERGLAVSAHAHEVPEGNVAASIAAHGAEEHADLIVLCTHGTGGVRDLLFGSIAQQVLQRGATPVLLVRPPVGVVPAPTFVPDVILIPLDATPQSEAAISPAIYLASRLGCSLHLVMVVATAGTIRGDQVPAATLLPSATRTLLDIEEERARAYLEDRVARIVNQGVAADAEVRRGDVATQLAGDATEHAVGLVVAATHGRAGLQATWAGSVAARLLGRTKAPILLLRAIEP